MQIRQWIEMSTCYTKTLYRASKLKTAEKNIRMLGFPVEWLEELAMKTLIIFRYMLVENTEFFARTEWVLEMFNMQG